MAVELPHKVGRSATEVVDGDMRLRK